MYHDTHIDLENKDSFHLSLHVDAAFVEPIDTITVRVHTLQYIHIHVAHQRKQRTCIVEASAISTSLDSSPGVAILLLLVFL